MLKKLDFQLIFFSHMYVMDHGWSNQILSPFCAFVQDWITDEVEFRNILVWLNAIS